MDYCKLVSKLKMWRLNISIVSTDGKIKIRDWFPQRQFYNWDLTLIVLTCLPSEKLTMKRGLRTLETLLLSSSGLNVIINTYTNISMMVI